jgi:hypothetical protein
MRKLLIGTAILVSLVGSASARVSDDGKMYIMARPPSNQVGVIWKGDYYWFHRIPPEESCEAEGGVKFEDHRQHRCLRAVAVAFRRKPFKLTV